MGHDVFISYSSKDRKAADTVCGALEGAGIACWIAPRDIQPGETWGGSIIEAIIESKVMLIIFSSAANDSHQVVREVERASEKRVVVIPFRIEDVEPTADMEYFLSSRHWLDAFEPPFSDHVNRLVDTVKAVLESASLEQLREGEREGGPGVGPSLREIARSASQLFDEATVPGFGGRPAIAVLPFDNTGGDPEQEYFADGITEDLITRLSVWRDFPVIARNSSFAYKGKATEAKRVSRELGVRYLVEGSVRRSGER